MLARGDGAFTTSKSGGRTITTLKTQKTQQSMQHNKQGQNKPQAVMLRHVFATARQATSTEVCSNVSFCFNKFTIYICIFWDFMSNILNTDFAIHKLSIDNGLIFDHRIK